MNQFSLRNLAMVVVFIGALLTGITSSQLQQVAASVSGPSNGAGVENPNNSKSLPGGIVTGPATGGAIDLGNTLTKQDKDFIVSLCKEQLNQPKNCSVLEQNLNDGTVKMLAGGPFGPLLAGLLASKMHSYFACAAAIDKAQNSVDQLRNAKGSEEMVKDMGQAIKDVKAAKTTCDAL